MKHTLTLLLGLFLFVGALTTGARAQNANITTVLQMSPNPSPYLSDWQSRRETVTLIATLDRPLNESVKLMAKVTLNGQIVAETKLEKMPMLTLQQGQNLFYANQLIPLDAVDFNNDIDGVSQRLGRLPAGNYQLCVGFVNTRTGEQLSSNCTAFNIIDYLPVVLVLPEDGAKYDYSARDRVVRSNRVHDGITITQLAEKNSISLLKGSLALKDDKNNYFWYAIRKSDREYAVRSTGDGSGIYNSYHCTLIDMDIILDLASSSRQEPQPLPIETMKFQWQPPIPTPTRQVLYRLRITPILSGQTAQEALLNTASGFDRDGITTTYYVTVQDIIDWLNQDVRDWFMSVRPDPNNVKMYAWSIQAHDAFGNAIGKNNGWSVPRTFEIGELFDGPRFPIVPNDPDFDLLRVQADSPKTILINSFFDVFADPIDWVDGKADSLKKLADSLRSKAIRLLDKVIDVEKIKEIIKLIGDSVKAAKPKPDPDPCPHVDKKLLRTVTGAWKKISSTVRHITVGKRTVAWVDVVWERDVFNVFAVSKCTLLKGHAGAHKMGPATEVKEKYGTFTEKMSYGPGVPIAPPKPHPTDSLPVE